MHIKGRMEHGQPRFQPSEGYRYIKREGSTKLEFDEKKGSASKERKA